jgi:hypothetical protein
MAATAEKTTISRYRSGRVCISGPDLDGEYKLEGPWSFYKPADLRDLLAATQAAVANLEAAL